MAVCLSLHPLPISLFLSYFCSSFLYCLQADTQNYFAFGIKGIWANLPLTHVWRFHDKNKMQIIWTSRKYFMFDFLLKKDKTYY